MTNKILFILVLAAASASAAEPAIQSSPNSVGMPVAAPSGKPKPTPKPRTPDDAVTPAAKDKARHQQFLARTKQGKINLLFLGDSITNRWQKWAPESWKKFTPYQAANFGIDGDRTEHLLWRITNGELDGIDPKVTVILIGTNNTGQCPDEKPEWAANGVKKVVETVHEKLPNTKVLLLGVFPCGAKEDRRRPKVEQINQIIGKLNDGNKTRFLDIGAEFLDEQGEPIPDIQPDKLHLTAKGYDIWYEAMQPLLDEMMK